VLPLALLLACNPGSDDTASGDTGAAPALAWTAVRQADPTGAWLCAWAAGPDDLWVAGGQPEAGALLRGDGAELEPLDLPAGTPLLNWVHGATPQDVWVGGLQGTLLRWDGSAWADHSLPTEAAVWGVYAAADGTVVAVGGESAWGGSAAEAWAWRGESWEALPLPAQAKGLTNLFKVRQVEGTWWLVGVDGAALAGPLDALQAVPTATQADLVTVHAPAESGPMVVVGGRGTGVILQGDPTGLAVQTQVGAGLNGVAVLPDGRAVVVGERGAAGLWDTSTGTLAEAWAPTQDVLHGAAATEQEVFAVGGNLYTSDDHFQGAIWRAALPE
jgi:hypothetical protein